MKSGDMPPFRSQFSGTDNIPVVKCPEIFNAVLIGGIIIKTVSRPQRYIPIFRCMSNWRTVVIFGSS